MHDTQGKELSWDTLHGLFENAIYGGRIDEIFDLKVLRAYIQLYFNTQFLKGSKKLPNGELVP